MRETCPNTRLAAIKMKQSKSIWIIVLAVVFISEISCNRIYSLTHRRYPVPSSFGDTLSAIRQRMNDGSIEKYIIFDAALGNCFGPTISAKAKIYWIESDKYWCRTIEKSANKKKVIDNTYTCDISHLFEYFKTQRLDTVATFPKDLWYIDPSSVAKIYIQDGSRKYETKFEWVTFTYQDTSHIMYNYFQQIMK